MTPLMWAAAADSAAAVKLLLAKGADPAVRDHDGRDALSWAESANAQAGVEALRAASGSLSSP